MVLGNHIEWDTFFINDKAVSKEEFWKFESEQEKKTDVTWYNFDDNIPYKHEKNTDMNIMGYQTYYKDSNEIFNFYTRNYYTKIDNIEYCIAESFGLDQERNDTIIDLDGDQLSELVCNCTTGADGHKSVYVFKRDMNNNLPAPSILIGSIDLSKEKLPGLFDYGVNSIYTEYNQEENKFLIHYCQGTEESNHYTAITYNAKEIMDHLIFEKFVPDNIAINIEDEYNSIEELVRDIPSTALSMKDEKFDTLYKNSGTYFESIDTIQTLSVNSEDTNYERKISDEEAIEIAKEHIGYEEYYKSEVSNISTEFLLYSNSGSNTERRPVIAVTFDGLLFSTAKNKPTVSQTKILVDSLTGDVVRLISVGHN